MTDQDWVQQNIQDARDLMLLFEELLVIGNVPVPVAMFALTHCLGRVLAASSTDKEHLLGGVKIAVEKLDDISMRYFEARIKDEMETKSEGSVQ